MFIIHILSLLIFILILGFYLKEKLTDCIPAAVSLLIVFMAGMTITADNTSALEASRAMFHIEKHVESDDHLSEETKEEAKEKSIEEPEELTEESAGK